MKPIQGRLKSFGVRTTQGEWTFDVCAVTGADAAKPASGADAQPQPSAPRQPLVSHAANIGKNNSKPPSRTVQQPHAESSHARDIPQCDDNDDDDDTFMEPLPRQPVAKKQCINTGVAVNATGKPVKNPAKYANGPTVRCAPSTLNTFVDHLTFEQRRRIQCMGFGGLLCVAAERLESRELLKFLFDRLDPITMVINVTKEKRIHVTPFAVKQVLDLPDSGEYIDLHTPAHPSKALSAFKTSVGLAESQDLNATHLQKILKDDYELGSALIDDDMAIRFFFIIACNKFLFPSTDNNIRCKDVYMTRDLSSLPGLNWCKAVVDDLRDAAVAWRDEKAKKSHSGCAIFLIILYLDNLRCKHQIAHRDTPRAKYFDQNVIKKIISADKTKDQQGKTTFGLLQLRNSIDTCYHTTRQPSADVPPSTEPLTASLFPSMQVQLGGLVAQICSSSKKKQAMLALANFDAIAKKASECMNTGQKMLQDAHQEVIHTLRSILHNEVRGNNSGDQHEQPHGTDAAPADDIDMYDRHFAQNIVSEHVSDHEQPHGTGAAPDIDIDMYDRHCAQNIVSEHVSDGPIIQPDTREFDGRTNEGLTQDVYVQVHQNMNKDQVLPTSHDNENAGLGTGMEDGELLPICTQVPHAVSHTEAATTIMTTSAANIVPQTETQVTDELPRMQTTEDDALGPILFGACSQDETTPGPVIAPRPQRLTKRPAMYVSPFKGDPQRTKAPITKAHAVRKKFHADMKWKSDVFIRAGLREFTGSDILDSFHDRQMLSTQFMSFFVACISHDERHMADGGGYRVFLSQELGEYVNIEEDEDFSQWESSAALAILQRDIGDLDPTKVKLFLLPVMEQEHYTIYCINFIHDRIDVLDSSAADHTYYHQVLGDRIIQRLNLLFQLATDCKIKQFTRFKRPIIDVCVQLHDYDCGFFALKFMELWNGDSFHVPIVAENLWQYRSQLLFYGMYHTINEIKKLPAGLEAHRPRR